MRLRLTGSAAAIRAFVFLCVGERIGPACRGLGLALAELGAECGTVMAVWGSKKGKRYVKFSSAAAAQAALAKDGSEFGGRPMRVLRWQQPAL